MSILKNKKYKQLFMGLLFDAVGMLSFAIPFVGEFSDIVWAPLSGWLMTRMYKGKIGQAAGVFSFVEEIIPGFDIIPSFTLMWLYTYVLKSGKNSRTIEV